MEVMYPSTSPYDSEFGIEFHLWKDCEVEIHRHNCYEFVVCIEGEIEHILNRSDKRIISKGQAVFITPNDMHYLKSVGKTIARHINVSVTKEIFKEVCDYFKLQDRTEVFEDAFPSVITLTKREYKSFYGSYERLSNDSNDGEQVLFGLKLKYFLTTIVYFFLQHKEEKNIPLWLLNFVEEISKPERFCEKLRDLYALSGYTQTSINNYFKQYFSMTMVEYLKMLKINYACNLLKNSNLSVLDIACEIGYFGLSHFNHIFKSTIGCTPTMYRRKHQKH